MLMVLFYDIYADVFMVEVSKYLQLIFEHSEKNRTFGEKQEEERKREILSSEDSFCDTVFEISSSFFNSSPNENKLNNYSKKNCKTYIYNKIKQVSIPNALQMMQTCGSNP